MGVVYVAHQISTARERALKIMLGDLADNQDLKRRFEQEARVGAQIESEHVVEVVGAGIDAATGSPWLAMELLQGEDFAAYLARGPLAPSEALVVFEQLAHALGAAHAKQIVHRDLKPENVFLARSRRAGASFVVKVLDFGIAKLLSQANTSRTAAMGTPLWMAPEQTQHGGRISASADVWALGLIAFRALAGRHFWISAEDPNGSSMMILREIVFEPIPPASVRAAQLGAPALPPGFDAWFARCVARAPEDRFQDASEMFAVLRSVLAPAAWAPASAPSDRLQRTSIGQPIAGALTGPGSGITQLAAASTRAESPTLVASKQMRGLSVAIGGVVALAAVGGVGYLAATKSGPFGSSPDAARPAAALEANEGPTSTSTAAPRETSSSPPPAPTTVASQPEPIAANDTAPSAGASAAPMLSASPQRPAPASTVKSAPGGKAEERPKAEPPKAEPPKAEPAGGGGEFDRGAASASLSSAAGTAKGCSVPGGGGPSGSAKVQVTFAPSGRVSSVSVGPPYAGTPTGSCIAGAFKGAKVPPFSGQPVTVSKTVTLR